MSGAWRHRQRVATRSGTVAPPGFLPEAAPLSSNSALARNRLDGDNQRRHDAVRRTWHGRVSERERAGTRRSGLALHHDRARQAICEPRA
jgi:hypothetical protein